MGHFIIWMGTPLAESAQENIISIMPVSAGIQYKSQNLWMYSDKSSVRRFPPACALFDGFLPGNAASLPSFEDGSFVIPKHYDGVFASAYVDQETQKLSLCRDIFGGRPLYFANPGGGIVAGTFLPALLAAPGISREPRQEVLEAIDIFGFNIWNDRTPFRSIWSVPPGHVVSFAEGGWTSLPWSPAICSLEETGNVSPREDELDTQLEEILVGTFSRWNGVAGDGGLAFSGGIDSSILLALSRMSGRALQPYTQCLPPWAHHLAPHDADVAKEIAEECGLVLQMCPITPEKLDYAIVDYVWHTGIPPRCGQFDLYGGAAFHALCEDIHSNCEFVYCGEGADELFMGYYRMHVAPASFFKRIKLCLDTASPAMRERVVAIGFGDDEKKWGNSLRHAVLHYGMSHYHLPSVYASASAYGMGVATPYLDRGLWELCLRLAEDCLIDRQVSPERTKLPLRRFLKKHALGDCFRQAATRRKRAMAYGAAVAGKYLEKKLLENFPASSLEQVLWELYIRLHISPGYPHRPNASILEVLGRA